MTTATAPAATPSPRTFTDAAGDDWEIKLNFGLRNRLKHEIGFDLAGIFADGHKELVKLLSDPDRFMQALYTVLERQIAGRKLEPEQFAERIDGPAWVAAGQAFCRAIMDFFQSPVGHAELDKGQEMAEAVTKQMAASIRALPVDFASTESSGSAGTAPSSSASTATASASENSSAS